MKKKFISLIKFSLDLFLYRTLHTGLKFCNFINFISHFSFHEKSARFLTMHKKICSVSETKLMSQRLIFVISVANGNITEIIFALKASWACLPHPTPPWGFLESLPHPPSQQVLFWVLQFSLGYVESSSTYHVCRCLRVHI